MLGHLLISAAVLRRSVRREIPSGGIRCIQCTYLLRGLTGSRCPECGLRLQHSRPARFELRPLRSRAGRVTKRAIAIALLTALVFLPVLAPCLPFELQKRIPLYGSNHWHFELPSANLIPLCDGRVYLIRSLNAVGAIVWNSKLSSAKYQWLTAYWSDADNWRRAAPDVISQQPLQPNVEVGPWRFQYVNLSPAGVWLCHRLEECEVTVVDVSDFGGDLPWVEYSRDNERP